jgi:hypothetical protein
MNMAMNQKGLTGTNSKTDSDYQRVRKQFYDLAEQGDEAIELMLDLARESEHPRAFEVLGQLIKNNAEIGEKILKLHKSKKDQDKDETVGLGDKTNNNVFIGSTAELQKMLRDEIVVDQEPDLFKE